jgi:glycosyltransferase involved in cell wall biosynthesis
VLFAQTFTLCCFYTFYSPTRASVVLAKKSIVIFTNTLLSGGAEKQALLLARHLHTEHDVLVVVYYGEKVEQKFQDIIIANNIPVKYLAGSHLKKAFTFYKIMQEFKADIIFSYLLTTNLLGAVIGKMAGVPCRVGGIRNAVLDKKKLPVQRFINNYLSTHTIYNNYRGLQDLKAKGFQSRRAVVIPNCFELSTTHLKRTNNSTVKIITVGRFVEQKGYPEALKAMSILKGKGLDFQYLIIGYGELEDRIRAEIRERKLEDVVKVIINPANVNDYYQDADIYLCSSHFEGLSNTVLEALSFSLPVVATRVGDNDRMVQEGENGFLVSHAQAELFIDPLTTLIGSSDLRNRMGGTSYQIVKEKYSAAAFRRNYENFITDCENA